MTTAVQFFVSFAGFSYDPKTETPDQGRLRCATEYAAAESWASSEGYTFEWQRDDYAEGPDQWQCFCRAPDGEIVASLSGIEFDNEPWGTTYMRVVQAELAVEALDAVTP